MIRLAIGSSILAASALVNGAVLEEWKFSGTADASAAIMAPCGGVLVATDEDNVLRLYSLESPGVPIAEFAMDRHLGIAEDDENPEADIEGATTIGTLALWITSHGRNRNGRIREHRYNFFATQVVAGEDGSTVVEPVGQSRNDLHIFLASDPRYRAIGIHQSIGDLSRRVASLAPKDDGFNIESLAASPDGEIVYIGLRNPRVSLPGESGDRAVVIPLLNALEYLLHGANPRLGDPLLLAAGGHGMRSMEFCTARGEYLLTVGPVDGEDDFAVYTWDGSGEPVLVYQLDAIGTTLRPEGLVPLPGEKSRVLMISDDGSLLFPVIAEECLVELDKDGNCENKSLRDPLARTFRMGTLSLPELPTQ